MVEEIRTLVTPEEVAQKCTLDSICNVFNDEMISLTFKVGQVVALSVEGSGQKLNLGLVGWRQGRYVILAAPSNLLVSGTVARNDRAVLRHAGRGLVFAFSGDILNTLVEPGLIAVSWPDPLQLAALTTNPRINVRLAAEISVTDQENNKQTGQAILTDLSTTGCALKVQPVSLPVDSLVKDKPILLSCRLSPELELKDLEGLIKNAGQAKDKTVLLGVAFGDKDKKQIELIRKTIAAQISV